jgi:hypothetical protein
MGLFVPSQARQGDPEGPLLRSVPDTARAGVSATSAEGLTGRRWTGGPRAATLADEAWRRCARDRVADLR